MRLWPFVILSLLPTTFAACALDDATSDSSDEEIVERKFIGKGDHVTGSCIAPNDALYCGGKSKLGNCWCDEACSTYGDCCSDYTQACVTPTCDPTMICAQVLTCVDGKMYPTGCGPSNCDDPIGPCGGDDCAPQDAKGTGLCLAYFGVKWNGSSCVGLSGCSCVGSDCDELYDSNVECEAAHQSCNEPSCNPSLICTQVLTCVGGKLYPTGCGPANCDEPIGACS
ncbi:MAG TPA: hypothetical protein VFB62_24375 [Polyangiaceae bacterium]|jgi:hypothetical protein|nr:hypothetical protein [Polyangiaceae bacterium]